MTDAFTAGFLCGYLRKQALEDTVKEIAKPIIEPIVKPVEDIKREVVDAPADLIKRDAEYAAHLAGKDGSYATDVVAGPLATPILLALLGSGIGAAAAGRGNRLKGLALGTAGGFASGMYANTAGAIAAGITPSYTDEDVKRAAEQGGLASYVPGLGSYRMLKHLGHGYRRYVT